MPALPLHTAAQLVNPCPLMCTLTVQHPHENRVQMLHVYADLVYLDRMNVAFKLSEDTICELIEYHKKIGNFEVSWDIQKNFETEIRKFIYWTDTNVLQGLEEDGTGEFLCGLSHDVKNKIICLFVQNLIMFSLYFL
jgi:hypothetical protein